MGYNTIEQSLYRNAKRLVRQIKAFDEKYDGSRVEQLLQKFDTCKIEKVKDNWDIAHQSAIYQKRGYVIEADIQASKDYDKMLSRFGEGEFTVLRPFVYRVSNPHAHKIKACVFLQTDFWEIGKVALGNFYFKDKHGKRYYTQRVSTIRGSFLTTYVTLEPKESLELTLVPMFIAGAGNILHSIARGIEWCSQAIKKDLFFSSKHMRVTLKDGIKSITYKQNKTDIVASGTMPFCSPVLMIDEKGVDVAFVGSPSPLHLCCCGRSYTKYRSSYSFKGVEANKLSCNIYYTFYKKLKKIEVSCDLTKGLQEHKAKVVLQFPTQLEAGHVYAENDGMLCLMKEGVTEEAERGIVVKGNKHALVITGYDSSSVSFRRMDENSNMISFTLTDNVEGSEFEQDNACMLESRFAVELCDSDQWNRVADEHDVEVISVRKGEEPYGI